MQGSYKNRMAELGNLRFPSGAEFDKSLSKKTPPAVQRMLNNLADNYPSVPVTKVAQMYRAFCEEREKAITSSQLIAEDQFYGTTRPEYLFQILGDMLFINEKAGGAEYSDNEYRDFLIKVKKAYFGGSRLENINKSLSDILGVPVSVKEMYLDARKAGAPVSIKDTHRMIADILMGDEDGVLEGSVSTYIRDLYYFIDLIRPSHSLFETRLLWKEKYPIAGCLSEDLTQDANGNSYSYVLSPLANRVFSLYKMAIGTEESLEGVITEDWEQGVVSSVDLDAGVVTLADGTELVLTSLSLVYQSQVDGVHRIEFDGISVGANVFFFGSEAQGSFNFHDEAIPQIIQDNPYAQYDPLVIESSAFQSNVLRQRDSSGRSIQNKACSSNLMGDVTGTVLLPMYEDLRDNCDYPTPRPFSEEFVIPTVATPPGVTGYVNLSAHISISEEGNQIVISRVPLVAQDGSLAEPSDILVYMNGKPMEGAVSSVDPWTGVVTLSFLPVPGASMRVDYFYHDAYPSLVEEIVSRPHAMDYSPVDATPGSPFDLGASSSVISTDTIVVRFQWPFKPIDLSLYGNSMSYQVNLFPILTREGALAEKEDISVYVDGVEVVGAVVFVRPLLGHIQLNFITPPGTTVTFRYYYQKKKRSYPMIADSAQHLADMVYGVNSSYTLETDALYTMPEGTPSSEVSNTNLDRFRKPAEYNYRFRAFDLSQSSVMSSKDTMQLNDVSVPASRGSWVGSMSKLSRYKLHFSGEYLTDTDKYIELNDLYLFNGLKALTVLRKGVPPFFRSFTSFADFKFRTPVVDPGSTSSENGFNVPGQATVDNSPSGLVEFVPVDDFASRGRVKLYSGLVESLTVEGDESINLSSICDERGFDLNVKMEEEYYPNREMRLNDYKDYVKREETSPLTGKMHTIQASDIVKAGTGVNWVNTRVGTNIIITWSKGGVTREIEYTLISVLNRDTARLDRPFAQEGGVYDIVLKYPFVTRVDVSMNDVVRRKVLDLTAMFPSYRKDDPNFSPWEFETAFADPDPDPYPRNLVNQFMPIPPAPLLTSSIGDEAGEANLLLSPAVAEKMVKFRNWDQEMIVLIPQAFREEFVDVMDDTSEGTRFLYWHVGDQEIIEYSFRGMVMITRENLGPVTVSGYPNAVIPLRDRNDIIGVEQSTMLLKKTIVRQVLPDNTVDILVLDELERLP